MAKGRQVFPRFQPSCGATGMAPNEPTQLPTIKTSHQKKPMGQRLAGREQASDIFPLLDLPVLVFPPNAAVLQRTIYHQNEWLSIQQTLQRVQSFSQLPNKTRLEQGGLLLFFCSQRGHKRPLPTRESIVREAPCSLRWKISLERLLWGCRWERRRALKLPGSGRPNEGLGR